MLYLSVLLPFIIYLIDEYCRPIVTEENKFYVYGVSIFPALYFIMFRFAFGADYFSYELFYRLLNVDNYTLYSQSVSHLEPGFKVIMGISKIIGLNYQTFLTVIGFFTYLLFIKWLYEFTKKDKVLLSFVLMNGTIFIVWVTSGIRQGLVMAIGVSMITNNKRNFFLELCYVLILSLFHKSAIFLLIFIILKRFDSYIDFKILLTCFMLTLVIRFIPQEAILFLSTKLRVPENLIHYFNKPTNLVNFSFVIRLTFTVLLLLYLKVGEMIETDKYLIKMAIFGFFIYFLLPNFETIAARLAAFSMVLMIPVISNLTFSRSHTKVVFEVFVIAYSLLYLQKDIKMTQIQNKQNSIEVIYKMKNILNVETSDYLKYDKKQAFLNHEMERCSSLNIKLADEASDIPIKYTSFSKSGKYGIVSSKNQIIIEAKLDEEPIIKDNYAIIGTEIFDLKGNKRVKSKDRIKKKDESFKKDKVRTEPKQIKNYNIENDLQFLKKYLSTSDTVKKAVEYKFSEPFHYSIVELNIYDIKVYYYLNQEGKILIDNIFNQKEVFDDNSFLKINTYCGKQVYNMNGELIQ